MTDGRRCLECQALHGETTQMLRIDKSDQDTGEPDGAGWLCYSCFSVSMQKKFRTDRALSSLLKGAEKVHGAMASVATTGAIEKTWDIKIKEQGIFKSSSSS